MSTQMIIQQKNLTWHRSNTKIVNTFAPVMKDFSPKVIPPLSEEVVRQKAERNSPISDLYLLDRGGLAEIRLPRIDEGAFINQTWPRTAPIQIWEGEVLSVDQDAGTMRVLLSAKIGNVPDHTAEINLEWVVEQDKDLVRPGAVFYWTLYKETKRGSINNGQELRFRRLPTWSKNQIERVHRDAKQLFARIRTKL